MIVVLGDLHFNSSKPYFIQVAEEFLSWYRDWDYNNDQNDVIFVGDLVNSAVNGGLVIEWLEILWKYTKFRHMYVVQGNHDYKKKDGIEQLAYEFYKKKSNVTVVTTATTLTIEQKKVLLLPYYHARAGERTMSEAYSDLHTKNDTYDIVVGHFADDTFMFGSDVVRNLDKIKTRHLCLGHIHTRINPKIYIGSIYANKVNETEPNRAAWIIHEDGSKTEEPLPVFCEYVSVRYPDPLPPPQGLISIYTLLNCPNEQIARATYGDIHIRKLVRDLTSGPSYSYDDSTQAVEELDIKDLFKQYMKQPTNGPLDRKVASLCLSLL